MNDYKKLIQLLSDAQTIAEANIENAHNIDLVDISQTLDEYIDELNAIENFEVYGDENDDDFRTYNEAPYGQDDDEDKDDDDSNPLTDHMDFVVY